MISTHILDLEKGKPAANVTVGLEKKIQDTWTVLEVAKTNEDGRIVFDSAKGAGVYRLNFQVAEYFNNQKKEAFFTEAPVTFEITDANRKYHVPLLLNTFGYSTYRGS